MSRASMTTLAKHGNTIGIFLALTVFGVVILLGIRSERAADRGAIWVDHTRLVIESLDALALGVSEVTSARRGYSLTGDDALLDRYASATATLHDAEVRVRTLTQDNANQQRRLDDLERWLARFIGGLDGAIAFRRTHGLKPEREAESIRGRATDRAAIRGLIEALIAEERHLLEERARSAADDNLQSKVLEVAGASVSLSLILVVVVRLRREIRRREKTEQAIAQLNEDLERRVDARTAELRMANQELESFSYSVVHDLRAPLRGMGGFAEVLLDECADTLSAEAKDSLGEIKQNARHMACLIDALVAMSRITRSEMRRTLTNLTLVARNVTDRLAAARPLPAMSVDLQENLNADVDPALAHTLFEILLENAWKFSAHKAAPHVDVGASETNGERVFFVRDTGAGFDMAHASKLFAPFGRLHTVGEFPGMGIGLAMAQRIVQRHGGRIWGDGKVGQGATFYFTLLHAPGGTVT